MTRTQKKESIKSLIDWNLHKNNKMIYREYVMKGLMEAAKINKLSPDLKR